MAAKKTRNKAERAARLELVSRLYLQKYRLADIAEEAGVTKQQICYDLKAVRALWLASAIRDFDEAKSQELAKLDALEESLWEAWRKSTLPKNIKQLIVEKHGRRIHSKKDLKREEESVGDPRYLAGIQRVIDKRCELLGLDAPIKTATELTVPRRIQIEYVDPPTRVE